MIDIQNLLNAPELMFFFFFRNFANQSNGLVEKWVFIAKIYGQLTKQYTFGKKQQEQQQQTDHFCHNVTVLEYDELI